MKEITEAKKKAIRQVLRNISETGNPTCGQILFLQMFFGKDSQYTLEGEAEYGD